MAVWAFHDDLLHSFLEGLNPSIRSLQFLAGHIRPPHSTTAPRYCSFISTLLVGDAIADGGLRRALETKDPG